MTISHLFYIAIIMAFAAYGAYTEPSGAELIIDGFNCERTVTIIEVLDGDTVKTDAYERIRFTGINTPELGEPGSLEAKNFTEQMILGKTVCIDVDDTRPLDKYDRTLAVILVGGANLNKQLLDQKLARIMYIKPSEFNPYNW
ncbi:MAG: thermonuclease family protein [Candidatus Methanoperedenaceae archaeon]|nr:thermonuclease family protein [Candidatus Methanoperedenaceae archaeon]